MEALLSAVGTLANLGAESASAAEDRRAEILAEADAAYHAWKSSVIGFWAGLKADDERLDVLAGPVPTGAGLAPPAEPTPPVVSPPVEAAHG